MDLSQSPITIALIVANAVFSFIGFSNQAMMTKTIGWPYYEKRKKQYYRWITSGFLHADMTHLIFNMFTLFSFGGFIETKFGDKALGGNISYLVLYFSALLVSNIPAYLKHKDDANYRSLGASGAVSAVLFAAIVFDPWSSVYLYLAFGIPAILFAILYIIYCVYSAKRNSDNINHDAHLWGAVYGVVFTLILIAVKNPALYQDILQKLSKPHFF
jgi:membrane associated rhomboid family serine protease